MTPADLARVAEAIAADERTEAATWPLSRERTRLYLALAKDALNHLAWVMEWEAEPAGDDARRIHTNMTDSRDDIETRLAALAPDSDAGAEAGETAPKPQ